MLLPQDENNRIDPVSAELSIVPVDYAAATCDANVEDAIEKIGDYDVTGIAMAKTCQLQHLRK